MEKNLGRIVQKDFITCGLRSKFVQTPCGTSVSWGVYKPFNISCFKGNDLCTTKVVFNCSRSSVKEVFIIPPLFNDGNINMQKK